MSASYLEKVSRVYLDRVGRGLMLSSRDLERVLRWQKAGIPEFIVVQAIEDAFDARKPGRVSSIAFAAPFVERAANQWRAKQAGADNGSIDRQEEWEEGLLRLIRRLETFRDAGKEMGLIDVVNFAITELKAILQRWQVTPNYELQKALGRLEEEVFESARLTLHPLEQLELDRSVNNALEHAGCDSEQSRALTRASFMRRRLRQKTGLPVFEINVGGGWS